MPEAARILAIDYGRRRVGLAVSDALGLFARPVGTFAPPQALDHIARLHADAALTTIVLGWPLEEDGTEGPAVARVRRFAGQVEETAPGVPIVRVDERYSSEEAKARLHASGRWKKARHNKGLIDSEAACVLLGDYLRER